MAKEMVVLQGKSFSVELQSMLGSTNYGWTLTGLSEGIALLGTEISRVNPRIGPVIQRFLFGAISATKDKVELDFTMVNLSDFTATDKKYSVLVKVIPSDSEEFVKLSEKNEPFADVFNSMPPYGFPSPKEVQDSIVNVKYGYPCGVQDSIVNLKYGYPCGVQDSIVNVKYGYPCNNQDPVVKYGFPCGDVPITVKYGYPCGVQDSIINVKYGYPCGIQNGVNVKYGYPCDGQDPVVKYGYPCDSQDPVVKYGYPCDNQNTTLKYGYPCGVQDATLKTQNAAVMYGFKCDNLNSKD